MKILAAFMADLRNIPNLVILSATGGRFAHVVLVFILTAEELAAAVAAMITTDHPFIPDAVALLKPWPTDGLYHIYFESICKVDALSHKTGVRGPYNFTRVEKWLARGTSGVLPRRMEEVDITNTVFKTEEERVACLYACVKAVKEIEFAKMQIFRNWLLLRFRHGEGVSGRTPTKWTCSEFLVRVFPAEFVVWVLGLGDVLFDEFVPSGKRGPGLCELLRSRS